MSRSNLHRDEVLSQVEALPVGKQAQFDGQTLRFTVRRVEAGFMVYRDKHEPDGFHHVPEGRETAESAVDDLVLWFDN